MKCSMRILLLGWLLLIASRGAFAAPGAGCTASGSYSIHRIENTSVRSDLPVGMPITGDWLYVQGQVYQNCEYDYEAQRGFNVVSGLKSYISHNSGVTWNGETVFDTNVPGIGYVLEGSTQKGGGDWSAYLGMSAGQTARQLASFSNSVGERMNISDRMRMMLIKTGTVQPGTINSFNAGYFYAGVNETNNWAPEVPVQFMGGQIVLPSCALTTPDISVDLGKHAISEFSGIGSTVADWRNIDIGLNCDSSAIKVYITVDAPGVSGTPGVMSLDSAPGDTGATGVGVQLWLRTNNGSPITFGKETYVDTSANQGAFTVPLEARYYQTAAKMTAGVANATATFTMTYK